MNVKKYNRVRRLSVLHDRPLLFEKNYGRIPFSLHDKLSASELAYLVDAFYYCHASGLEEGGSLYAPADPQYH